MLAPATVASIRERNHFVVITSEHTIGSILKRVTNLVVFYFIVFILTIIFCLAVHAYYVWLGQLRMEAADSIQRFDGARSALFAAVGFQAQEQKKLEPSTLAAIDLNLSVACNALDSWRTTTSTLAKAILDGALAQDIIDNQSKGKNGESQEYKLCHDFDANTLNSGCVD